MSLYGIPRSPSMVRDMKAYEAYLNRMAHILAPVFEGIRAYYKNYVPKPKTEGPYLILSKEQLKYFEEVVGPLDRATGCEIIEEPRAPTL